LPSPLRSPIAIPFGELPVAYVVAGWNVPSALPSRTETVFDPALATSTSAMPSPLTSPIATPCDSGWKLLALPATGVKVLPAGSGLTDSDDVIGPSASEVRLAVYLVSPPLTFTVT